ncbi:MAG: benzoate/H(+) symporter BenE family transporter [Gemmatimonadota bacterium]
MRPAGASRGTSAWLPALIAGFTISIVFLAVLGIMLAAAGPDGLGLSEDRTTAWIVVVYGLPMIPSLVLTLRHRVPLVLTGNVFALIFFVTLGDRVAFDELVGASMLAGAIILLTAVLGVTATLARWIPVPIVQGLIAGAVMPFVIGLFSSLSPGNGSVQLSIVVGSALVGYLLSHRFLGARLPAVLPAFIAGATAALLTGSLGEFPTTFSLPVLEPIVPAFSPAALATVTPVLVALMTVQSNIPSVIYLRSQGFRAPERTLNLVSGAGTVFGSLLGPVAMSLALPPVLVTSGPAAGDRSLRYRSTFLPIATGLLIAVFASTATDLSVLLPPVLLFGIAGLALIPALAAALAEISRGPLVLGPLFAFAIALSDMTVFGLDPFFWSLVLGTLTSVLLERDGWRELRSTGEAGGGDVARGAAAAERPAP